MTASDRTVSCQLIRNIATIVLIATATLLVRFAAVSVTTDWIAADVVRQPALDLARPRLGEEAQGHPLEVRVERVPEVLHHVLADDVVEVRLADADEPGHDRDHDHEPDIQVQVRVVLADDDLVDEHAEQERVDQAQEARDQDRHHDDRDLRPVRPEERGDPPDRPRASLLRDRLDVLAVTGTCPVAPSAGRLTRCWRGPH